jgi:hypothetical protein
MPLARMQSSGAPGEKLPAPSVKNPRTDPPDGAGQTCPLEIELRDGPSFRQSCRPSLLRGRSIIAQATLFVCLTFALPLRASPAHQPSESPDSRQAICTDCITPRLSDYPDRMRSLWAKLQPYAWESGIASQYITGDEVLARLDYVSFLDLTGQPLPDNRNGIFEGRRCCSACLVDRARSSCDPRSRPDC